MIKDPLWVPSDRRKKNSHVYAFINSIREKYAQTIVNFEELWQWSINHPELFWKEVANYTHLIWDENHTSLMTDSLNPWEQHFFPQATLNYAENLLKRRDEGTAIIFQGEDKVSKSLSFKDLFEAVQKMAGAFKKEGLKKGDRVAAFVPNTPEAVIAMLAVTALGGVWCSGSPDFGVEGALDRFSQVEPSFLIAAEGYYYNGKQMDTFPKLTAIEKGLPTLKKTILFDYTGTLESKHLSPNMIKWDDFLDNGVGYVLDFEKFPFNHPLFIMFSSGTTGKPKCIVHGAGGTLLQHLKEHQLHVDIHTNDRFFYFTTCGWMMWNWLVSGLASGATLVLYDGSPFCRKGMILIDLIDKAQVSFFGVSAKYIEALLKLKAHPIKTHNLNSLKTIGSTGSPLSHEGFDYIYSAFKKDVALVSLSGGTDIVSCFVLGNPLGPVYRGQIQAKGLGMDVDVWDDEKRSLVGEKGELVCKNTFPCQPLYFWNDPENKKYIASYFERFKNIWCHGDFVEYTPQKGFIFHGRSDAVLNPGGVRIGTGEIYRQVEKVEEVEECFAIGQQFKGDERIILFVKLRSQLTLTPDLVEKIEQQIMRNTTRRHVPDVIIQAPDIPKTRSGKIVELTVRAIVHHQPVKNIEAIANPKALEFFKNLPELSG